MFEYDEEEEAPQKKVDYKKQMNAIQDIKNNMELVHEQIAINAKMIRISYEHLMKNGFEANEALAIVAQRGSLIQ